jgi:hypothetical protein
MHIGSPTPRRVVYNPIHMPSLRFTLLMLPLSAQLVWGKGPTKSPGTDFAQALDWDDGKAEILEYSVKKNVAGKEMTFPARWITEKLYYPDTGGSAVRKPKDKAARPILNSTLSYSLELDGAPRSIMAIVKLPRAGVLRLARQDVSLQIWPYAVQRVLECGKAKPRWHEISSGEEAARDTVIGKWPLFSEEMLFTYVRALPLHTGHREDIWLLESQLEERASSQARSARLSVREKGNRIREMETWHITVDREDGKKLEFWVGAAGLHPVVLAMLPDKSVWTLQKISRKQYWPW